MGVPPTFSASFKDITHIHVFGSVGASVRGSPVAAPNKVLALLVYLAEKPGHTDFSTHLTDLLWPSSEKCNASSLNQAVYTCRKLFGRSRISRRRDTVTLLREKLHFDTDQLRKAIAEKDVDAVCALYRGEFLRDCLDVGSREFEDWRVSRAAFYERAVKEFVLNILSAHNSLLDEHTIAQLHTLSSLINLNVSVSKAKFSSDRGHDVHVGRLDELAALRSAWQNLHVSSTRLIVVTGDPGIGKTSLVEAAISQDIFHGALILKARGYRSEQHTPYAVLSALAQQVAPNEKAEILNPNLRSAFGALCPGIGDTTFAVQISDRGARLRIYEALTQVLATVSMRQPILLYIDDLQWVDDASIAGLSYALRRLSAGRCLLVTATRSLESGRSKVDAFLRDNLSKRKSIDLHELSINETRSLVEHLRPELLKETTAFDRLRTVAGGHPILLRQVLLTNNLGPDAESTRSNYFQNEMRQLPPFVREVAEVLSVAGGPISVPVLGDALERSPRDIIRALANLASFCKTDSRGCVSIKHDLVAEIISTALPKVKLIRIHETLAEARLRAGEQFANVVPHLIAAQLKEKALYYSLQAADNAASVFAPDEAEYFFRLAIECAESTQLRNEIHQRLASLLTRYGKHAQALKVILEIDTRSFSDHDKLTWYFREMQCTVMSLAEDPSLQSKRLDEIVDAAFRIEHWDVLLESLRLKVRLANARREITDEKQLNEIVAKLQKLALSCSDPIIAVQAELLASCSLCIIDAERAVISARAVMPKTGILGPEDRCLAHCYFAIPLYKSGRLGEAISQIREGIKLIEQAGATFYRAYAGATLAAFLLETGDYDEAERILEWAQAASYEQNLSTAHLTVNSGWVAFLREDYAHCMFLLSQLREQQSSCEYVRIGLEGLSCLELGNLKQAFTLAAEMERIIQTAPMTNGEISPGLMLLARVAVLQRREDQVIEHVKAHLEHARMTDRLCYLRIQLAFAELLARQDGLAAVEIAKQVHDEATEHGYVAVASWAAKTLRSVKRRSTGRHTIKTYSGHLGLAAVQRPS